MFCSAHSNPLIVDRSEGFVYVRNSGQTADEEPPLREEGSSQINLETKCKHRTGVVSLLDPSNMLWSWHCVSDVHYSHRASQA